MTENQTKEWPANLNALRELYYLKNLIARHYNAKFSNNKYFLNLKAESVDPQESRMAVDGGSSNLDLENGIVSLDIYEWNDKEKKYVRKESARVSVNLKEIEYKSLEEVAK